jgi:hypothetical protein
MSSTRSRPVRPATSNEAKNALPKTAVPPM